jgi:hypothetical protein
MKPPPGTLSVFFAYNIAEVDLDAPEERPPVDPAVAPPAAVQTPKPVVMAIVPETLPDEAPIASNSEVAPESVRHTAVRRVVYKEPSDFYPGIAVSRARPTIAKFKYGAYDAGRHAIVTRYVTLSGLEAACALNAVEVLNGTHHTLYSGKS